MTTSHGTGLSTRRKNQILGVLLGALALFAYLAIQFRWVQGF